MTAHDADVAERNTAATIGAGTKIEFGS